MALLMRRATWTTSLVTRRLNSSLPAFTDINFSQLQGDDKGISILTLARPSAKNAIGKNLLSELVSVLDFLRHDRETRVLVSCGCDWSIHM